MKTHTPFVLVLMSLAASSAYAQPFAGYEPTVLKNENQADTLFQTMETRFKELKPIKLRFGSECTQRAETWSYDFAIAHQLKGEKVFVFYTRAYQSYYEQKHGEGFKWWFHVSPLVLVKTQTGAVEERVMDHTFAEHPQKMKDWTDLFVESHQACIENVPFSEFEADITGEGRSHDPTAHCYIVRAPMYDVYPSSIDARERGENTSLSWNLSEVRHGAKALQSNARKEFLDRVGL